MPEKEGEAVNSNRCLILFESSDLNKVYIFRVGMLTGEVGISELKPWPRLGSQWLKGISEYTEF